MTGLSSVEAGVRFQQQWMNRKQPATPRALVVRLLTHSCDRLHASVVQAVDGLTDVRTLCDDAD